MKKSSKLPLTIGIIAALIALVLVAGLVFVITTFVRESNSRSAQYSTAVQLIDAAPKSFTSGQVAQIGPYNITFSLQKGYQPSQSEADAAQKELNRAQRSGAINGRSDAYGYSLTNETGQYVLVTAKLEYSEGRAAYDDLSTSSKDWTQQFGSMTLNAKLPLIIAPDVTVYKPAQDVLTAAKSQKGAIVTLLYRIPKDETDLMLHYDITIFTKVSSFVGTEGMPSKKYEYTIGIQ